MKRSLRRTLALRFTATMAAALTVLSAGIFWSASRVTGQELNEPELLFILVAVIVLGSGATLVGASYLANSAVRPVAEITAQATRIEAGTLDQRIAARADTEEYQDLVAVLNRMLERLEAGFRAQRRLTADVSHELRTPLTALRGLMEVALRTERSPHEYQRVLRSALEEIDRLAALSDDLLFITRAESRLVEPQRVPVDPHELLRRVLDRLHADILEKGLDMRQALDPAVRSVRLDPALITQLMEHLLGNAVKFTPVGGRVRVATEAARPAERGVRVVVDNAGPSIPAQDLPHLFEPFYRVDQARSRGTGPGLGLALVAAIARLHGGEVRASNRTGCGVRFEVDLPAPANVSAGAP